jgi:hypothetical protein
MYVEYKDYVVIFENRNFDGVLWYQPRSFSESLSDSVTFSDSLVKGISPVYADSASASDEIAKLLAKPLDDSVSTSDDLIGKDIGINLSDSATPSDAITEKHVDKHLNDSAAYSDDLTKWFTKSLTDSVTVADLITNKFLEMFFSDEYEYEDLITVMKLDGSIPYVKPENTVFSEMRIKSIYGREPSNFYEIDEQGEEE